MQVESYNFDLATSTLGVAFSFLYENKDCQLGDAGPLLRILYSR
jgi:hypothetical protein